MEVEDNELQQQQQQQQQPWQRRDAPPVFSRVLREGIFHFHSDVHHDSGGADCRAGVIMNDMSTIKA